MRKETVHFSYKQFVLTRGSDGSAEVSKIPLQLNPQRNGKTLRKVADIVKEDPCLAMDEGIHLSSRVCSSCAIKVRNRAQMFTNIQEKFCYSIIPTEEKGLESGSKHFLQNGTDQSLFTCSPSNCYKQRI